MRQPEFAELSAFAAVAERSSFAKAATHLGISRSTLSEIIRGLEEKLGVRLLNRTTRSVGLTEVGERLLGQLQPLLDNYEAVVESINGFRGKPAGRLRLSVPRPALGSVIEPILARFLAAHPAISLEISVDRALIDIVRERFDAGIRPGRRVEKDMIAIPVGDETRPIVVASPDYLRGRARPKAPGDLHAHNCINLRFASGELHRWAFEKRGKKLEVTVDGSLTVNDGDLAVRAALDGVGICRVLSDYVTPLIAQKRLVPLLEDWAPRPTTFYLYYPSRRQNPAPLQALIEFVQPNVRNADSSRSAALTR